ncbi:MAG: sugar ABC transporter permease [Defluviitaleaceae bacterium]|nr:sugar ABC transporter permease [Defluviitaleaceae bacterium]
MKETTPLANKESFTSKFSKKLRNAIFVDGATLKSTAKAYLYLLPALIIIVVFSIYPIFRSLQLAFYTDFNFFTREGFETGTDNFTYVLNSQTFHLSLRNTITFVIGVVPLTIIISLMIALAIHSVAKGTAFFRSIYFLPHITSTIAIATVFQWIFHTQSGILNYILSWFGIDPIAWLGHPDWAMPALIIMSVWSNLGFGTVLLLAGLQTIDKGLYLAAKVDGAGKWHRFTTVTLPMLSPTIFFLSITSVIGSFRIFGQIFALFRGPGTANSALTVVYFIYQQFWEVRNIPRASAAALVLFAIIFAITLVQMAVGKKLVHYK